MTETDRRGDLRVEVRGQVDLGRPMRLMRKLAAASAKARVTVRADARAGFVEPQKRNLVRDLSGTGIEQAEYSYLLEREPDDHSGVSFTDEGLTQSYVVFGTPGSGKTFLLKYLLQQLVSLNPKDIGNRFGGLILDPKAALLDDIRAIFRAAGREEDLVILNEEELAERSTGINVIDCFLKPESLGQALKLALRAAGIDAKEPFWLNQIGSLFAAGLQLLQILGREATIADLVELLLGEIEDPDRPGTYVPTLRVFLDDAAQIDRQLSEDELIEFSHCRQVLRRHLEDTSDNRRTTDAFIEQGFGAFRGSAARCFSRLGAAARLYDSIIEDGRFLLVSVSKANMAISRALCTLVKTLFQRTVLTRLSRFRKGELQNYSRPLLFLVDEYSDVATELPGEPQGDLAFFSQMRQFGCMGLVATQSTNMLKLSSLGENWKALLGNMAAKIFLRVGDVETAEEASKLVAEAEVRFSTFEVTLNEQGASLSRKIDLKDRKVLPTAVVLQTLERGDAVIVGSLDGKSRPQTRFVRIGPNR